MKTERAFQYQQVSCVCTRTVRTPSNQFVWLMPITSHFGSDRERENVENQCNSESECAHGHAGVSSKAVTSCVWWKAPDVACLLMCNKKAQLGQKAKEANEREKGEEWRKEGVFKRLNGGIRSGCKSFSNGCYQRTGLTLLLGRGTQWERKRCKIKGKISMRYIKYWDQTLDIWQL